MDRRKFISLSAATAGGFLLVNKAFSATAGDDALAQMAAAAPRHILLRSGWQTENIGDIAHTPAMLALLEKPIPGATVTFWPWYAYLPPEEVVMLNKRFPAVKIVEGKLGDDGKASTPELQQAIASADFFLHNSGPLTVAWKDALNFKKVTGKPFGVFGVTYGNAVFGTAELPALHEASFVYLRDSVSLGKVKEAGVRAPVVGFAPDAVFAIDVTDDEKAVPFLKAAGLEEGKFLCCIPRHRLTPVWQHKVKNKPFDAERHARNEAMKEHDHKPLREAITAVVRYTDHKILICNEDMVQQSIGKEWLLDLLPEDVKPKVVWLDRHWLTDEAISVYRRSAGLFGNEMHSPIMCIANDIPAIVCRWEEQTSKGFMWRDIGLGDWLFNFDNEEEVKRFVPAVLAMAKNPKAAKAKAVKAREYTASLHKEAMKVVEKVSRAKSSKSSA